MRGAVRDVILVHGLWVPALVMTPLGAMLARAGLRVHLFGYRGRKASLTGHADRLIEFAGSREGSGRITSYNVCYTKLLRARWHSRSSRYPCE